MTDIDCEVLCPECRTLDGERHRHRARGRPRKPDSERKVSLKFMAPAWYARLVRADAQRLGVTMGAVVRTHCLRGSMYRPERKG